MIWIFHREIADAASADNYDELHAIITDKQNLKLLEDYLKFEPTPWSFTFFTPQQVFAIYANIEHSLRTEIVKEAHEKEVGFISICQGNFENRIEILDTPDIDREALKKQWCLGYCDAHDYIRCGKFLLSFKRFCSMPMGNRRRRSFQIIRGLL